VTLGFVFWLLMVLVLVVGFVLVRPGWPSPERRVFLGGSFLWWVLLAILGWAQFGPPLR
jgi:hypothetical protein